MLLSIRGNMMCVKRDFPALVAMAVCLIGMAGCAARVSTGYRVYDPYYRDYHVWAEPEPAYYRQWVIETHRRDRDYRRLGRREQREYWQWRHAHRPDRH